MEMQTTVQTKTEIILGYGLNGHAPNLAANSNNELVLISCQGFGPQDKPSGISLYASDKSGNSVSIALNPPKKPWEMGGDPEIFDILMKLLEEKKFGEIQDRFFIQRIM